MILSIFSLLARFRNINFPTILLKMLAIFILVLSACTASPQTQLAHLDPGRTSQTSDPGMVDATTQTPPAAPIQPSTPSTSPSPVLPQDIARSELPIPVQEGQGPDYELVFSLAVGEDGVQYRGEGIPDALVEGPSALGVFSDGTFAIADQACQCLLRFSQTGELLNRVGLQSLNIHLLSDMTTAGEDFLVLEAGFGPMPEIYRVYRVSPRGELSDTFDLPGWARHETGLSGISSWPSGEILLEMEGGSRSYLLLDANGRMAAEQEMSRYGPGPTAERELSWKDTQTGSNLSASTDFTFGIGGLRLLSLNPDRSIHVLRTDLVDETVIQVDQTVHWISEKGDLLGMARYPQNESYYFIENSLDTGPDGNVYALIPRPERVDVVRLIFYVDLEPLLPGAVIPDLNVYFLP
jgi:hypothetical protein